MRIGRIKATGAKAKTRQTFKDANLSQGKINRRLSGIDFNVKLNRFH
jgi:hypothetical protein